MREVQIPKMGMATTEVEVVKWYPAVGDSVKIGDALVEVETEKVTTILEAEIAGTLVEIVVFEGEIGEVGAVLCRISETETKTMSPP